MRVTFRIPGEMYAFTEVVLDFSDDTEPSVIAEKDTELRKAFAPKPINVLPDKEFDTFIINQHPPSIHISFLVLHL